MIAAAKASKESHEAPGHADTGQHVLGTNPAEHNRRDRFKGNIGNKEQCSGQVETGGREVKVFAHAIGVGIAEGAAVDEAEQEHHTYRQGHIKILQPEQPAVQFGIQLGVFSIVFWKDVRRSLRFRFPIQHARLVSFGVDLGGWERHRGVCVFFWRGSAHSVCAHRSSTKERWWLAETARLATRRVPARGCWEGRQLKC